MGHIRMPSEAFVASLSENAGTRSGIALSEAEILQHLGDAHPFVESITARGLLRISSVAYADAVGDMLFALGASNVKGMPSMGQRLLKGLCDEERRSLHGDKVETVLKIEAVAMELCRRIVRDSTNVSEVVDELKELLACLTIIRLEDVLREVDFEVAMNPFLPPTFTTQDLVQLNDLFDSEILPVDKERFFDQRFIDYLARNPSRLQEINWRRFEGLAAEWFQRNGYDVEIGPGRNDGGVDIRLWRGEESKSGPPTIIVQCKRHKNKVDSVTIKALYSDIQFEDAESGLIVTTSDITPSAKMTINVRNYPINAVNKSAVRSWILKMKNPGAGFLKFDDKFE